mmetsp:Transcript_2409/g.5568  ORF Transcript_2409/g.5568 Transcript_2409/m.5568 type:complete len:128 (+) Transcript_2409:1998-2381(+)
MVAFQRRFFLISFLQLLACSIALVSPEPKNLESLSISGNEVCSRRDSLKQVLAGVACGSFAAQPASAKYSDYSRREKDWEARNQNSEIKYSNARQLKAQLQEIAPMNTASSKVRCFSALVLVNFPGS